MTISTDSRLETQNSSSQPESKRPAWLTFFCETLRLYVWITTPLSLFFAVLSFGFHEPAMGLVWILFVPYFAVLIAVSIGLERMKKWGALLYLLYLVLDIVPNILFRGALLISKAPWLFFCSNAIMAVYDRNLNLVVQAPWFSFFGISSVPFDWINIGLNVIYYGAIAFVGFGIWQLWKGKQLT